MSREGDTQGCTRHHATVTSWPCSRSWPCSVFALGVFPLLAPDGCCFCARGPGLIEIYEGKLDGKALRELLKKTVLQTAKTYFDVDHAEKWWFQHDGSPPFR